MRKVLSTGIILLLVLVLSVGCGKAGDNAAKSVEKSEKTTVRVANVISPGGPPQGVIMLKKGFLKEKLGEDYKIEDVYTRNIDQVSKDMKDEKYDFLFAYWGTIAEYASNMSDFDNGNNFVVIANISNGPASRLVSQPTINDIKQLDGKTVGVYNHDYTAVITIANTLKKNGLDFVERGGTVKLRLGDSSAMTKDLINGKLDALMARSTFQQPKFTVLVDMGKWAYGYAPYEALMVRKGFLKEHPDVVEKLLEAHVETTEWMKDKRAEAAEIMWPIQEKYFKDTNKGGLMPPKEVTTKMEETLPLNVYPNLQFIKDAWDYMDKYNPKKPYAMKEITDFTILDKVLKAKGMPSIEEYNKSEYNKS